MNTIFNQLMETGSVQVVLKETGMAFTLELGWYAVVAVNNGMRDGLPFLVNSPTLEADTAEFFAKLEMVN